MKEYYIYKGDVQTGPFTEDEIEEKLSNRELAPDDMCWTDGMEDWQSLRDTVELPKIGPPPPPNSRPAPPSGPPPPPQAATPPVRSQPPNSTQVGHHTINRGQAIRSKSGSSKSHPSEGIKIAATVIVWIVAVILFISTLPEIAVFEPEPSFLEKKLPLLWFLGAYGISHMMWASK